MIMIISFGRPAFETFGGKESINIFNSEVRNLLPGTPLKVAGIVTGKIDR